MNIEQLKGVTLVSIVVNSANDEIVFTADTGERWMMYHSPDCCETVNIESIVGDLRDLIGSPILYAEEAISNNRPEELPASDYTEESETWTFYKLATFKGYVDIRWFGSSNGYYSESVDFKKLINS